MRRLRRRGDDRPEGARPGARGRRGVAVGADPGRRHRAGPRGATRLARAHAPPLSAVVSVLDARRLDRHARRRSLRDALHPHRRPRRVGPGADTDRSVGVAPASWLGRRRLARPDADWLRGHARRDHRGVGQGPPAPDPPRLGLGAVRGVRRRGGRGQSSVAVRPVPGELPPDRRPRGRGNRRRRRVVRAARARVRVGQPRRRAVDDDGAGDLRRPRRYVGAARSRLAEAARPSGAGARRFCAPLTCAMCS